MTSADFFAHPVTVKREVANTIGIIKRDSSQKFNSSSKSKIALVYRNKIYNCTGEKAISKNAFAVDFIFHMLFSADNQADNQDEGINEYICHSKQLCCYGQSNQAKN